MTIEATDPAAANAAPNGNNASAAAAAAASKRAKRKARARELKKQKKLQQDALKVKSEPRDGPASAADQSGAMEVSKEEPDTVYVPEKLEINNPQLEMFGDVLQAFSAKAQKAVEQSANDVAAKEKEAAAAAAAAKEKEAAAAEANKDKEEEDKGEDGDKANAISNKQRKKLTRLNIAELKQAVARPDVVESHDCNSSDPILLVTLKAARNSVPVPRHWLAKRKYMQGKRGFEKTPFRLPQFIEDTGIGKLRGAQQAADDGKSTKARARDRMQPKMGKIEIDYNILHDAFFRFQTKPEMTKFGDIYYEGKELTLRVSEKKAGILSEELKQALGMNSTSPPPWLANMQRYGPPPSYPHLKIPGVNCPIPPGAKYGHSEGEWGRPPVDEFGRSLWGGDVFGTAAAVEETPESAIDKKHWGEVEEEEEEEEAESEGEQEAAEGEGEGDKAKGDGEEAEGGEEDEDKMSGITSTTSLASGLVTPDTLQIRKRAGTGTETPSTVAPQLYQVLEEKAVAIDRSAMFGSAHTYVLPTGAAAAAAAADAEAPVPDAGTDTERKVAAARKQHKGQVEVTLNPEELEHAEELPAMLQQKYQQQLEAEKADRLASREEASEIEDEKKKKRKMTATKSTKEKKFKWH